MSGEFESAAETDIGDAVSAAAEDATEEGLEEESIEAQEEEEHLKKASSDAIEPNTYNIKPTLEDRFKQLVVKEIIHSVLVEELSGKAYTKQDAKLWTTSIANIISSKIRDMKWKRYKHIVQVTIGEQSGAGVKSSVKCVWDSETDNYASDVFLNEHVFCLVTVFAVYFY